MTQKSILIKVLTFSYMVSILSPVCAMQHNQHDRYENEIRDARERLRRAQEARRRAQVENRRQERRQARREQEQARQNRRPANQIRNNDWRIFLDLGLAAAFFSIGAYIIYKLITTRMPENLPLDQQREQLRQQINEFRAMAQNNPERAAQMNAFIARLEEMFPGLNN